ncbi:MAG: glycosyltransferase family 2 protein [Candidatus Omnitrophica bacterium]|nr:glycosyltransferase family 2 protein [Candidatus Omnitrophota bacterium]
MKYSKNPLISIVTPTYNRVRFLDRLIKNVFSQTNQDFELILVDDGSTDHTKELIDHHILENPGSIHYIFQQNQGAGAARNTGLSHSKGKYIAFLDSDDEWLPDYLEKTINVLEKGEYHWTVTGAKRIDIDKEGREIDSQIIKCNPQEFAYFFKRELSLYEALLTGNVVGETSRIVVLKQAITSVGGFRDRLKLSQDYELWLRLAKENYKLCIIDEPLVLYRKSVDSLTKTHLVDGLKYGLEIINHYSQDAIAHDPMFKKFYAEKLWDYARMTLRLSHKDYFFVFMCIIKSLTFDFNPSRIFSSVQTNLNARHGQK